MKSCNNCGKEIKWPEPYKTGNLPLNLDGSEHRCKGKETRTVGTPREMMKDYQQESLAGLEDLEKAELQSKDPITDDHIYKQMQLIGKIEKEVKTHFVAKYGQNYSEAHLGLWVKLIYQNMSS